MHLDFRATRTVHSWPRMQLPRSFSGSLWQFFTITEITHSCWTATACSVAVRQLLSTRHK